LTVVILLSVPPSFLASDMTNDQEQLLVTLYITYDSNSTTAHT
jgi:hypothetical protein